MSKLVVTVADVLQVVAEHYGVSVSALKAQRRAPALNRARHIAYWLARVTSMRSTPEIGRAIGDRDHSTVIHGARCVDQLIAEDSTLAEELVGLQAAVIAIARLRERRIIAPVRDIDPLTVALRVATGGERIAGSVSIDEIRAVCEALAFQTGEQRSAQSLLAAAREAAQALHEQTKARFTIREPAADVRVRNALEALSKQFHNEEQANG